MSDREELEALRRMAELEAKANGQPAGPATLQEARPAPPKQSLWQRLAESGRAAQADYTQGVKNKAAGLVRGAGSIGNAALTALESIDAATKKMGGLPIADDRSFMERYNERAGSMDAALQGATGADPESAGYQISKLGGEIAGTAGVGAVAAAPLRSFQALRSMPAVQRVANALESGGFRLGGASGVRGVDAATRIGAGAAVGGASAAMINPKDAAKGAVIGATLPPAVRGAAAAGRAVGQAITPRIANPELAQKALDMGIPLGIGDVADNAVIRAARSVLNDAPFTASMGAKQKNATQSAYNRAVSQTFGEKADKITPEVMDSAKSRMGSEFDRLWGKNRLMYDEQLFSKINQLHNEVHNLPHGDATRLQSWLDDFESKFVPDANGELSMPGNVANNFQSDLRKITEGATGFTKKAFGELRGSIIDTFNKYASPDDVAALTLNRKQYKAYKTVEPLIQKAEAGVAGREVGNVSAAMLPQRVYQQYKGGISSSPFADLSQIGSQYVADRVARTGGSARAAVQNSALLVPIGVGATTNPLAGAATIPSAMLAQKWLGSSKATQKAIKRQLEKLGKPIGDDEASILRLLSSRSAPAVIAD